MRIGIDLGGTKIEGVALTGDGREIVRRRVPTPAGDYDGTVRAVADLVAEIAGEAGSTLLTVTHDPIFIDRLDVVHHMVLGKFTDGSGDVRAEVIGGEAS